MNMPPLGEWARRVMYFLRRSKMEAALQEEMWAHRAMMGEPRRFGNTLRLREQARDVWGWAWLDNGVRDIRFAARGLRRTPTFTLVAVLSLGIGLAVTTAMVSVVNAYLIRSFPYPEGDRLYHLRYAPPGPWEPSGMTGLDWRSVEDVVEYPIAAAGDSFYLTEGGQTLALRAHRATRAFVEGLGVSAAAGRGLVQGDFAPGAEPVALIAYAFWRDRFGGDPAAIGRVVRITSESRPDSSETFRIVGVLTPGFYFGRDSRTGIEMLVPHAAPLRVYMVRLREGVPRAAAERRLTEAARRAATSPIPDGWTGVQLESVRDRWSGVLRPALYGVTTAAGLVLVIVCANVAVLMLLRALRRQKEVAVRVALGSGWRHIARMLLAETSLVCASALALGLAVTALLLRSVSPLIESQFGRPAPSPAGITIDTTVLFLVGGVSLVVAVALSLAPLASGRGGLTHALAQDARVASEPRSMQRLRHALIAFEVAGSLVLLVACGLMVRSVIGMLSTDLGFEPDRLNTSRVMLRAQNYPDAATYRRFHERFAQSVSNTIGSAIVFSSWPPFVPPPVHLIDAGAAEGSASGGVIAVTAEYFSTFGIPLRQGRDFSPHDASTEAAVAIVSESLARRLWPGGNPLGRQVRSVERTQGGSTPGPWRTVIGVAADVRQSYADSDRADFYTPRMPDGRFGTFYVRTDRPAPMLFETLHRAASAIDRDAVINPPRPVAGDNTELAGATSMTWLLAGLAGAAASLSMLGIYGVTAYAVQQRNKEVAIRMALGASDRSVVRMFLRDGAVLLSAGTVAGVIASALLSRMLRDHIVGVQSNDLLTYVIACGLLLGAGFAAVFWAARGAVTNDLVRALTTS